MSKVDESGLRFEFDDTKWSVIKYDDHIAHKKVSNKLQPTKAVDILGIFNDNQLFFIEIKNYLGHTGEQKTKDVLSSNGDELMNRIAIKVRDTIATTVNSARYSINDSAFFSQTNQILCNDERKITIIAWIEFDEPNIKEQKVKMSIWREKLKKKLSWIHRTNIIVTNKRLLSDSLPNATVIYQ